MEKGKGYRTGAFAALVEIGTPEKLPTIAFRPAYSGGLLRMDPNVWPLPTVFDVDGLEERPQTVPIIRDHDQNQKVGQTTKIVYDGGRIVADGELIHYGVDEAANKVVALWKRGARLQASVATGIIAPEDVETVPEGATASANGRVFNGPVEIVRRWRLKEISVVTLGADDEGTGVSIANASYQAKSKGEKKMSTLKRVAASLGLKPGASVASIIGRVAQAAKAEGDPDPDKTGCAEGEDDPNQTGAAEGEDDPDKTGAAEGEDNPDKTGIAAGTFEEFCVQAGYPDISALDASVVDALRAAYNLLTGAAEGENDPDKTGAAEGEDDPNKTGTAEGEDDPNKSATAAFGVGPRPFSRTKYPARYLNLQSSVVRSSGRPSAARVAEAALMLAGNARGKELEKLGYSQREIDAATSAENRNASIMKLLYRTGAARAGYDDQDDVAEILSNVYSRRNVPRVGRAAGQLATIDIPNVLANVMHKSMLNGINKIDDPTDSISRVVAAKDFREQNFVNLFLEGEMERAKSNGELETLKVEDENFVNRASVRGFDVKLTYEQIANDDMNALLEIPRIMGRKAALKKQALFWKTLAGGLSNVASVTGNPTLGVKGLDKACAKFDSITDKSGDYVGATPRYLIVPNALKATALNLINATQVLATGGPTSDVSIIPNTNRYAGMFEIVATRYLGQTSPNSSNWGDSQYLLLADPADVPLMITSYYKNQKEPTVQTVYGQLAIDGLRVACWWAYGVSVASPSGAVLSSGSGS